MSPLSLNGRADRGSEALSEHNVARERRRRHVAALQSAAAPCLIAMHDPRACHSALRRLARWCQRFSPYVGLEDADEPESLLLDITGCAHLFGGEREMVAQIVCTFGQRRLLVQTAIAGTIGAAWALAHCKESVRDAWSVVRGAESKVKITDDGQRTTDNGQPLTSHHSPLHLHSLPIEALRLPAETVQSLREFDLRTVEQVEALPRSTLPSRFGAALLMRLDQLFGRRAEMFTPERDSGPIEAGWLFEDPVADCRALEIALGRLIEQVVARLESRGEGVVRLGCWMTVESRGTRVESPEENEHRTSNMEHPTSNTAPRTTDHEPRTTSGSRPSTLNARLTLSLARPTRSLKHLRELVRLQLERLALPAAVTAVHVRVTAAAPLETRQLELFATDIGREQRRCLEALIERLTSRLGERSILQPRLIPDFQPEFAARFEPLLGQRTFRFSWPGPARPDGRRKRTSNIEQSRGSRVEGREPDGRRTSNMEPHARRRSAKHKSPRATDHSPPSSTLHHPSSLPTRDRPLRLLTAPIYIHATSVVPDGPPIRFPWRGREHRVARWWGPERIETGWWRGPHVRRDYYRVDTTSGERFWLFRERTDGEWFVHGVFE